MGVGGAVIGELRGMFRYMDLAMCASLNHMEAQPPPVRQTLILTYTYSLFSEEMYSGTQQ